MKQERVESVVKAKPVITENGVIREEVNIEELETYKKALEWQENQDRMKKNPGQKAQTHFMNLRRNDSIERGEA